MLGNIHFFENFFPESWQRNGKNNSSSKSTTNPTEVSRYPHGIRHIQIIYFGSVPLSLSLGRWGIFQPAEIENFANNFQHVFRIEREPWGGDWARCPSRLTRNCCILQRFKRLSLKKERMVKIFSGSGRKNERPTLSFQDLHNKVALIWCMLCPPHWCDYVSKWLSYCTHKVSRYVPFGN